MIQSRTVSASWIDLVRTWT